MQKSGNIEALFAPKSIAVIGSSSRQGSVGRAVFTNILLNEYTGTVYPVNPKDRSISGVRSYPSIGHLPECVDVAVVVVPAAVVPAVTEECWKKGVKGLIIISAGFKEVGQDGAALERQVASLAQKYSMRMVGPTVWEQSTQTQKSDSTLHSPHKCPWKARSPLPRRAVPSARQ